MINFKEHNRGFSLIEMAISFIILGLILAPAAALYHSYRIEKDIQAEKVRTLDVMTEISNFSGLYGRYPCPADPTAARGSPAYGIEDCASTNLRRAVNAQADGRAVVIGSLPFKTLNLQEDDTYDENNMRLRYAVTEVLTAPDTFDFGLGAIDITDANGNSVITPEHSGHFVVVAHGRDGTGAFTSSGAVFNGDNCSSAGATGTGTGTTGTTGTTGSSSPEDPQKENCDDDERFVATSPEADFDDNVRYFATFTPSEWETPAVAALDINSRNVDAFAVGAQVTEDLSGADEVTIKRFASDSDSGFVRAATSLLANRLCHYDPEQLDATIDPDDCFEPRLIGGTLAFDGQYYFEGTDGGISCYNTGDTEPQYLVGIQNGEARCSSDLVFNCPDGEFVIGIDGAGQVECTSSTPGESSCPATNRDLFCGTSRTIAAGEEDAVRTVYSGECYFLPDEYDRDFFEAAFNDLAGSTASSTALANQMRAQIVDPINAGERIRTPACNTDAFYSLVREDFTCTSGRWAKGEALEKGYYGSGFGTATAEHDFTSDPLTSDPNNSGNDHDCWCREDFRVVTNPAYCPENTTGVGVFIERAPCPKTTGGSWHHVYTDTRFCTCQPGTRETTMSCMEYYIDQGIEGAQYVGGTVRIQNDVTCDGNTPTLSNPRYDFSDCRCRAGTPYFNTSYCPVGTANDFSATWDGLTYGPNLSGLLRTQNRCEGLGTMTLPDGVGPVPAVRRTDNYTDVVGPIPACTNSCIDQTREVSLPCTDGTQGGEGRVYEQRWDCSLNGGAGGWEDQSVWSARDTVRLDCGPCEWVRSAGAIDQVVSTPLGETVGSSCNCNTDTTSSCSIPTGSRYNNFACQCTRQ